MSSAQIHKAQLKFELVWAVNEFVKKKKRFVKNKKIKNCTENKTIEKLLENMNLLVTCLEFELGLF